MGQSPVGGTISPSTVCYKHRIWHDGTENKYLKRFNKFILLVK